MVDCSNRHALCTKCVAIKVKEKGCDHKLKCYCGKREEGFTLMKTDLIDRALASNYYDCVIEEEDEELGPVRSYKDIHSNPGFFLIENGNKKRRTVWKKQKEDTPING